MNATYPDVRPIDRWFAHYSDDHRNAVNQRIHVVAVPLILWSVTGLLWCVPVPGTWFLAGTWAVVAMYAAWMFYFRASRRLGVGMLVLFVAMAWLNRALHGVLGTGVADPEAVDPGTLALREVTRQVREDDRLAPTLLPLGEGLLAAIFAASFCAKASWTLSG